MQLIDPTHPLYKPLWVRVLIVAVCFGWAIVEAFGPQPFWAVLAGGLGAYAAWVLLLTFDPAPPKAEAEAAAASEPDEDDQPAEDKK